MYLRSIQERGRFAGRHCNKPFGRKRELAGSRDEVTITLDNWQDYMEVVEREGYYAVKEMALVAKENVVDGKVRCTVEYTGHRVREKIDKESGEVIEVTERDRN